MFGRGLAGIVGLVGGAMIIIGGLLSFLATAMALHAASVTGVIGAAIVSLVVIIFGFVVLFLSRPRWFWWPGRRLMNGVLLVVIGAIVWLALGSSLLITIGAALAILAGAIYFLVGLVPGSFSLRRRLS